MKFDPGTKFNPSAEFQLHAKTLQQHGLIIAFVQVLRDVPE
jgi:hypothetical protein